MKLWSLVIVLCLVAVSLVTLWWLLPAPPLLVLPPPLPPLQEPVVQEPILDVPVVNWDWEIQAP